MVATQPTLFDPQIQRELNLQGRFERWLTENPHIIPLFLRYAREAKATGLKQYGIGAITERVRWHVRVETKADDFKINNNWRSRIARELVRRDPSLAGFFEFRTLKA